MKRFIAASVVWLIFLSILAMGWRYFISPMLQKNVEQEQKTAHNNVIRQTSSNSRYKHQINFAFDSFSGYSILRSEHFAKEMENCGIKCNFVDDKADYLGRLKRLASGELEMAVFTLDALVKTSAELGDLPAAIIAFVDETRGADAMITYKAAIPNIDALNSPDVKFILTPDSPSETLARVIISHFGLKNLDQNSFIKVKDAEEVYKKYLQAKPADKTAFVLWEPYVTKMLENPNTLDLVNSSKFRGYIGDVIVANRDFLVKNEIVAIQFVEAYLKSVYYYVQNNKMTELVANDSKSFGTPLNDKQIERLIKGIWWKNTNENYAHMGLNNDLHLQHIEDMLNNIVKVLLTTNAISKDPTNGQPNLLYYDRILSILKERNFHPGFEETRADSDQLPALNEQEWSKLISVGTLDVPSIAFARGTANIGENNEVTLKELVDKLKSWPQYYLVITGNASLRGDIEANKALARQRAESVKTFLSNSGISETRIRAIATEPTGNTEVVFTLGYLPY